MLTGSFAIRDFSGGASGSFFLKVFKLFSEQVSVNLSDEFLARFLTSILIRFLTRFLARVLGREKTINIVYNTTRPR